MADPQIDTRAAGAVIQERQVALLELSQDGVRRVAGSQSHVNLQAVLAGDGLEHVRDEEIVKQTGAMRQAHPKQWVFSQD